MRGDAPVGGKALAVEEGQGHVGVADVDRKQHGGPNCRGPDRRRGRQFGPGARKGAGLGAETKEGVALGGAH